MNASLRLRLIALAVFCLAGFWMARPSAALADAGGFPTSTPTVTPLPSLTSTVTLPPALFLPTETPTPPSGYPAPQSLSPEEVQRQALAPEETTTTVAPGALWYFLCLGGAVLAGAVTLGVYFKQKQARS